jgi:hypothetical protein
MQVMDDLQQLRVDLLSDFFLFNRFIFKERTGRDFIVSKPVASVSHFIEIANALELVFHGKIRRLAINCPPGWAKSELIKNFICWCYGWFPDCNNIYISYAHELAASHTHTIKQTMMLPIYRRLFNVEISRESSAKDFFKTTDMGSVAAFGSSGAITGRDAGLPGLNRYSGGVFIDDIHKPDEIHSDVIREKIKRNYIETIEPRCRGFNVPIVIIGQRLHQDDLFTYLLNGEDGNTWTHVNIRAEDNAGNPRYPEVMPIETLRTMKKYKPYVYYSQYLQEPVPAGGGLFQKEWFKVLDETPEILSTFITADTAETDKEYNDATVFSFWGVYNISINGTPVDGMYGLHWIDCRELRIEPKDLENEFLDFWTTCMRYSVQPKFAAIEKKSSGVTLLSILNNIQGLRIIDVERSGIGNSKTNRFIAMQQYIAEKRISLPSYRRHTEMCIEHMSKITANNVHRFDDIADTCYDAIKMALIDKIIIAKELNNTNYTSLARNIISGYNKVDVLKRAAYKQG